MLKLCDVARVFAITSLDFSCALPELLTQKRRKRVQCLKKEFGFLMHPHRCGVKKHRSKIDNQSWEVSTPTNSCTSFSSGDPPSGGIGCKCVSETAEDGFVRDCDVYPDGKRIQVDRVADGATPSVCNGGAEKTFLMKNVPEICEGTTSLELRVPPIILRRVPAVNGCGFRSEAESENGGLSLDEGEEDNETNDDLGAELNLLESFSCQRTQAYAFIYQSSCARVCKTWPFPRSGPPDELRSLLSGHRWIVTSSFPDKPTTSTSIPEKGVQDTPCKEALEAQAVSSVSGEKLESHRSVQRALEDSSHVPEVSAFEKNKQVDNEEFTHVFNSEGRSPKSQRIENHCILGMPGQKAVSFECENQLVVSVLATEDSTSPSRCILDSKCTQFTTCPVSQTPLVENQVEPKIGAGALYNPDSLSELCLKVETLKAQCLSSSTSPSTAVQVTQKPASHTLNSKPPYSGKRKRRRGFDSSTVTDSSSSADENERDSKPSSDEEHVEPDEPGGLRLNDDVTSHIKDRGVTPSQSVKDCMVPKGFLDVSRAYEEDVLILDVIQDDPDLFGAVVAEAVNKPGTMANHGETNTKFQIGNHCKIVWDLDTDR